MLGVLGANGTGKSILLATLTGLTQAAAGTVEFDGVPITQLAPRDHARHNALLPQDNAGGYFGSVADFVALGWFPPR